MGPGRKFLTLDHGFFAHSGIDSLDNSSENVVVFLRQSCHDQLAFIQEEVIQNAKIGVISGTLGTGKSMISYCYAASISREPGWDVIWLNFDMLDFNQGSEIRLVIFSDGSIFTKRVPKESFFKFLREMLPSPDRKILFILDGWTDSWARFAQAVVQWFRGDQHNRRVLTVSTMETVERTINKDYINNIERHKLVSWTWEEFVEAISCEEFYCSIADMLDAPCSVETRLGKLRGKFFYAGACARFMFNLRTHCVMQLLKEGVTKTKLNAIHYSVGKPEAFNGLLGFSLLDELFFVSEYVHVCLSEGKTPQEICSVMYGTFASVNRETRGILFEILFFSIASYRSEISFFDVQSKKVLWENSPGVKFFNPLKPNKIVCTENRWLRPSDLMDQGFSGVWLYTKTTGVHGKVSGDHPRETIYQKSQDRIAETVTDVSEEIGVARFVQITCALTHPLKLQYINDCVCAMNKFDVFRVKEVEVFFIVPVNLLAHFRIDPVESPEALVDFDWPHSERDVRAKVKFLALRHDYLINVSRKDRNALFIPGTRLD